MLVLKRIYLDKAVHGRLYVGDELLACTIELPWKQNAKRISCIPEGIYTLRRRYSEKFKWHLVLLEVPERSGILIHPANDALKELQGCIAPVTAITEVGKGSNSRKAMQKVMTAFNQLNTEKPVTIHITREMTDE
ncbi:MAG: DUF5675 family protein [Myroides sp.]|nr:DUF5675 family protein [Myroides sp.]